MSSPYIGEIRLVPYNFAPVGWAFCNGQLLAIADNDALFNLIGTTYGGDGQTTFELPDLQGRVPIHQTSNYAIGQLGGTESVTLTTQQIPAHNHMVATSASGNSPSPAGHYPAVAPVAAYGTTFAKNMAANSIGSGGGSQPHDNRQPSLTLNFIISLFGIFPSQT